MLKFKTLKRAIMAYEEVEYGIEEGYAQYLMERAGEYYITSGASLISAMESELGLTEYLQSLVG